VDIDWKKLKDNNDVEFSLSVDDRPGFISDLLESLSKHKVSVKSLNTLTGKKNKVKVIIEVELLEGSDFNKLKTDMNSINGVLEFRSAHVDA